MRYLNQREILVDFYGVFAVVFVEKRLAMSIFVGKKCREKKIHNSYIDITYIDTYAKLHINQEKIYITHIQIYSDIHVYVYIYLHIKPPFIDGQSTLDSSGLRVLQCFLVEKTHLSNAKFFKNSRNNKKKMRPEIPFRWSQRHWL